MNDTNVYETSYLNVLFTIIANYACKLEVHPVVPNSCFLLWTPVYVTFDTSMLFAAININTTIFVILFWLQARTHL